MSAQTTLRPTTPPPGEPEDPGVGPDQAWRIVSAREITVKLKDRTFLISTAITLVVIVAGVIFQAAMANHTSTKSIATTQDGSTVVATAGSLADHSDQDLKLEASVKPSTASIKKAVESGDADAGLVPAGDGWRLIGKDSRDTDISTWLGMSVQQLAMQHNAQEAGTTLQELQKGSALPYTLIEPGSSDSDTAKVLGFAFGFIFYMSSLIFGLTIATSVVEEKQNRIVEILASAIPLRQLLIGKVVGNSVLAVAQLVLFTIVGLVAMLATGNTSMLSNITAGVVWFIVFYLVGFVSLACVWAVAGALATRNEDVQSTSTPISMAIVAVFLAGILVTGTWQVVLSYLPLFSTIAMPIRVVAGTASWWEPLVALVIAALVGYGIIRMAGTMYRRSLMQTSRKLGYREALRLQG